MQVTVRNTVCSSCPFRVGNSHTLIPEMVEHMVKTGTISPCHRELKQYSGSENSGVEVYAKHAPVFKVCRGYVESRMLGNILAQDMLWAMLHSRFMMKGYCGKIVNIREII